MASSIGFLSLKFGEFWERRIMTSQNKRTAKEEEEFRQPPEVVEFCRIIAGVLRRTPQGSLGDVESADDKGKKLSDFNKQHIKK